jgi:HAD superfamily hydrolase (TIGR01509 family)
MIRGIIFDFDGLIVDTEWSVYQSWVELFDSFGAELPLDQWTSIIGTSQHEHFDPFGVLEQQVGELVDRQSLRQKRRERELALVRAQPILPGVEDYLQAARSAGLKLGIASSSDRRWVAGNLARLGMLEYFEVVHTSEDVERTKPDPTLYRLALRSLGLQPNETLALEDSPNGITAAKRAGIYAVAVPNPLTACLNLDHADLLLGSLAEIPLADLIKTVENHWNRQVS